MWGEKKTTECDKNTATCDVDHYPMWQWNCQMWLKKN